MLLDVGRQIAGADIGALGRALRRLLACATFAMSSQLFAVSVIVCACAMTFCCCWRRGVGGDGKNHLDQRELRVVDAGLSRRAAIDEIEDVIAGAGADRIGHLARIYLGDRVVERRAELARRHPADIAAGRGAGRLRELLRHRGELRAAADLLDQAGRRAPSPRVPASDCRSRGRSRRHGFAACPYRL